MCYPVCGMVHIKEPLLLIGKSSPCGGSRFLLSLSEWSFIVSLNKTFPSFYGYFLLLLLLLLLYLLLLLLIITIIIITIIIIKLHHHYIYRCNISLHPINKQLINNQKNKLNQQKSIYNKQESLRNFLYHPNRRENHNKIQTDFPWFNLDALKCKRSERNCRNYM